jgi:hypothetical protein
VGETRGENIGRAVLAQAQLLGIVALVAGAIPGWIGGLFLKDAQATASLSSQFHWALFVLFPAGLIIAARPWDRKAPDMDRAEAFVVELLAGFLGAAAGNLLFFLASTYIPTVFGGLDWATLQRGFIAHVGWAAIAAQIGIATVSAIPIVIWKYRQETR